MTAPTSTGPIATGGLVGQLLGRTVSVGIAAFVTLALLAPGASLLDASLGWAMAGRGALVATTGIILSALLAYRVLHRNRFVLRSLALGSHAVEPADVGALADLPFALTSRFLVVDLLALSSLFVPPLWPEALGTARAISLGLLGWTVMSAAAVVHYVVVRAATLRVIEHSPTEPITEWLEHQATKLAPRRRVVRKILVAVVAPVALVGVGTLLVTQAHLRAFVERDRTATAIQLARATMEPVPGALPHAGRDDAIAAAAAVGFEVRVERSAEPAEAEGTLQPRRDASGLLSVRVPLDEGTVHVRYGAELGARAVVVGVLVAFAAVLLAALLGSGLGRRLAQDLVLATEQVGSLGTDRVLRGQAAVAGPARFAAVAALGRAVEALAERFREFARAHERAIAAKQAAQRMKELLFASVSHDLKSPLNAVLGLAELVREEPLTAGQSESLELVASRGRELLALIETILDAARVEAGQLELVRAPMSATALVQSALEKSRDLCADRATEVVVELGPEPPTLLVDPAYAPRALAVLVSHAVLATPDTAGGTVRVSTMAPTQRRREAGGPRLARIRIEYPERSASPAEIEALLRGVSASSAGRGMVLRLGLARSLVELHGGKVAVERTAAGAGIVSCWLPLVPSPQPEAEAAP